MFSGSGVVPWHRLGTVIDGAANSDDAVRLAKLDWRVIPTPIYTEGAMTAARMLPSPGPRAIPGFVANVREDTNTVLGIVTDKYCIAQNKDAFKFADDLLGLRQGDAQYETAGSLRGGRMVWMLINLPTEKILGDDIGSYLAVVNYHDGSGAMKAFTCATRIVCSNTLHTALREDRRSISIRHMSTMDVRKREATRVMKGQSSYFNALRDFAEMVSGKRVDAVSLLQKLFPVPAGVTQRVRQTVLENQSDVLRLLNTKDDLQNFRGNGWGFYNAVSDWYSHRETLKRTATYRENRLKEYFEGVDVLDRAKDLLLEVV
jgi:phage/plasmid-like protein (TIGR03299 family)